MPAPGNWSRNPFFFFTVWGGGDVNVPVNLLISCMLRELRGLGGVGEDVNVPVNLLTSCLLMSCMLRELRGCLGYIYIYNISQ